MSAKEVRITRREVTVSPAFHPEFFWFTVRMMLRSAGIDPDGPLTRIDHPEHIVYREGA